MRIKCVAIDDEPLALEIIKNYSEKVPFLDLIKTFDNAVEFIDFFKNNKVDLLFLDIQMEELTGIQLLNILNPKPNVIFTTAYDSFAITGFELDAVDDILESLNQIAILLGCYNSVEDAAIGNITSDEQLVSLLEVFSFFFN